MAPLPAPSDWQASSPPPSSLRLCRLLCSHITKLRFKLGPHWNFLSQIAFIMAAADCCCCCLMCLQPQAAVSASSRPGRGLLPGRHLRDQLNIFHFATENKTEWINFSNKNGNLFNANNNNNQYNNKSNVNNNNNAFIDIAYVNSAGLSHLRPENLP